MWLAVAVLPLAVGCGGTGVATVRTIQLSPNTGAIDAYVSNTQVAANIPYGSASPYSQVGDGDHTVEITPAGRDSTSLYKQVVEFYSNTNLTVFAVNPASGISELVLTDNNDEPDADDFKLRIVNAAPGQAAAPVDIYVTAPSTPLGTVSPTFTTVPYLVAENYLELPAGSYQVTFTNAGTTTVVAYTTAFTPSVGDIYTVALADSPTGGAPYQAYAFTDAMFSNNANQ
jgi:hypothetical protein